MARAFRNSPRGIVGRLEKAERDLLRHLFDDVILMLEPLDAGSPAGPASEATSEPERDPLWDLTGLAPEDFAFDEPESAPEPKNAPEDPALRRLLPDAVKDDDAAAAAFRGLTESSVRQRKLDALRASQLVLEAAHLELDEAEAQRFAAALNDVRLVLAERIGIQNESDALRVHELEDWAEAETIEDYLALVYNFVGWVQESLMQALLDTLE